MCGGGGGGGGDGCGGGGCGGGAILDGTFIVCMVVVGMLVVNVGDFQEVKWDIVWSSCIHILMHRSHGYT